MYFFQEFIILISVYGLLTFASGSFDLTDNGLMNTMLGPEISRPFVQSLHALAAVGFVVGKFTFAILIYRYGV